MEERITFLEEQIKNIELNYIRLERRISDLETKELLTKQYMDSQDAVNTQLLDLIRELTDKIMNR